MGRTEEDWKRVNKMYGDEHNRAVRLQQEVDDLYRTVSKQEKMIAELNAAVIKLAISWRP